MRSLRIADSTRYLGAPVGWKAEGKQCANLAIRDERTTLGPIMISAWELEPHEIEALVKGAPLYLTICGEVHPPVEIRIGEPPK